MHLAQVFRYDVLHAVNQLSYGMSKPSKAHIGAAKHLLRHLARSTDCFITYKQGWFKLAAFSDFNWGNNPDNAKPTSSRIVMLGNGPISFEVRLQGLTGQSTLETARCSSLTMNEVAFCKSMMQELGFKDGFDSVTVFIDNTLALDVAGSLTYSPRAKQIALRYFFIQELIEDARSPSTTSRCKTNLLILGLSNSMNKPTVKLSPKSGTLEPERQRRPCP